MGGVNARPMSFSVPADVRERMENYKGQRNWSKIAVAAIRSEIEYLERITMNATDDGDVLDVLNQADVELARDAEAEGDADGYRAATTVPADVKSAKKHLQRFRRLRKHVEASDGEGNGNGDGSWAMSDTNGDSLLHIARDVEMNDEMAWRDVERFWREVGADYERLSDDDTTYAIAWLDGAVRGIYQLEADMEKRRKAKS